MRGTLKKVYPIISVTVVVFMAVTLLALTDAVVRPMGGISISWSGMRM